MIDVPTRFALQALLYKWIHYFSEASMAEKQTILKERMVETRATGVRGELLCPRLQISSLLRVSVRFGRVERCFACALFCRMLLLRLFWPEVPSLLCFTGQLCKFDAYPVQHRTPCASLRRDGTQRGRRVKEYLSRNLLLQSSPRFL